MANPALTELPPFTLLEEPDLSFSPSDATQVDVHQHNIGLYFGYANEGKFRAGKGTGKTITVSHHNDLFQSLANILVVFNNANGDIFHVLTQSYHI